MQGGKISTVCHLEKRWVLTQETREQELPPPLGFPPLDMDKGDPRPKGVRGDSEPGNPLTPEGNEHGIATDQRSPAVRPYLLVFLEKLGV